MRIRFIRAGIISIVATVVLAVITLAIIGTSAFGDSADLSYRTLDYDVTATANGDLKVTQHIDVKMRERTDSDDNTKPWKQLFQQYTLNSGTLTDISDISVRNVTDGIDYAQQSEPKLPSDVSSDKEWNSDYQPLVCRRCERWQRPSKGIHARYRWPQAQRLRHRR